MAIVQGKMLTVFLVLSICISMCSGFQVPNARQSQTAQRTASKLFGLDKYGEPATLEEAEAALKAVLAGLPEMSPEDQKKVAGLQEELTLAASEDLSAAPVLNQFAALAEPPFDLRVPGEQGQATLVTDPAWLSVLLALRFLGLPCDVVPSKGFLPEDRPSLVMGQEVVEDAARALALLCERYVLSDLVESATPIQEVVAPIYPSFLEFLLNKDSSKNKELKKALQSNLYFLDKRLQRSRGEYIESDEVTISDLVLAPQLHHMQVALKHFKNFSFSPELKALNTYADNLLNMEVVRLMLVPDDLVVAKYAALR
mmetsp:Transcript_11809/g.19176  ORF Transcript_11809/g.19176 Transcript_11809/m.19176 type:complete len:313 (-) Transcript_11809:108-1046(-)